MRKVNAMVELQEFFVEGGDRERSHVLLHITEPSTAEEEAKGYFFAVCEIGHGATAQIEHLQQMIDDLESGYYETDDTQEKDAFETTLEYINRRGHHVLENSSSVVHCLVGVLRGQKISMAYHGQPSAHLFYDKKGEIHAMDIFAGQREGSGEDQLFSAVLEGSLKTGDYLAIATPHVAEHITTDRLKKMLPAQPLRQSVHHIQKMLSHADDDLSYGGILMHIPDASPKPAPKIKSAPLEDPEAAPEEKKVETNYRPRPKMRHESFFSLTLITVGRALVAGSIGIYRILKMIAVSLWRVSVGVILLITNRGGQRQIVLQSLETSFQNKKKYVAELPLMSKILFLLAVLLGIVFAGSVGYMRWQEAAAAKKQAYQFQIQAIVDKKTAAEASLIYGDTTKALTLLQEASALMDALPQNSKEQKDQRATLMKEVDTSLQKLRKRTIVQPELIADLASTNPEARGELLTSIDDLLIAYGPDDDNLYVVDPDLKKIETKNHSTIRGLITATTPKEQDKIVFLTKENGIAEYQKQAGALAARTIDVAPGAEVATLFVYNQRLYSVDTKTDQIYKHSPTQTGYDRGTNWLKETGTDLSGAVSLAIDGDVFVLKNNGELLKFTAGKKQAFDITALDPILAKPTTLWTYNDVERLYILEPEQKRIIVLDKSGKLLQQYTAEEWQRPTGMIVRETERSVYVLDSNKIYRFQLL